MKNLRLHGMDSLIICGGDGSFHGALELKKLGINVICIPCTIDNDMGYTDYAIGFDTAVGTVLDAVSKIQDTASSHDRTTIVEVMGRNCGQAIGIQKDTVISMDLQDAVEMPAICNLELIELADFLSK